MIITRKFTPSWKYQLSKGKHHVHLKVLNPTNKVKIHLKDEVFYSDEPSRPIEINNKF